MSLLALATVTSDGHPLVGPVDGIFYRGAFYFGSSPESLRSRHIRRMRSPPARPLHQPLSRHGKTCYCEDQII